MRPFALLCLLCVWVAACDRPATQIVVRVDSDMREGEELRAVRVTLRRVGADRDTYDETFDLTQGTLRLPGTVGVVPGDPDDTRRLEVEARALVQNGDDFSTRALVSFQPEQTLLLDLYLAARCRNPDNRAGCGPDETCGPDGCTAITRARLPGFEPDAARLDAPPREEDAALDEDIPAPTEEDIPAPKDEDIPVAVDEDIPVTVEEDIPAPLDVVVPCGGRGEMCCAGGVCRGGDRCVGGVCVACGGSGQACCVNDACGAGSACVGGTCAPCGGSGQPCCAGRRLRGADGVYERTLHGLWRERTALLRGEQLRRGAGVFGRALRALWGQRAALLRGRRMRSDGQPLRGCGVRVGGLPSHRSRGRHERGRHRGDALLRRRGGRYLHQPQPLRRLRHALRQRRLRALERHPLRRRRGHQRTLSLHRQRPVPDGPEQRPDLPHADALRGPLRAGERRRLRARRELLRHLQLPQLLPLLTPAATRPASRAAQTPRPRAPPARPRAARAGETPQSPGPPRAPRRASGCRR